MNNDKLPLEAIHPDQFAQWLNDPVTEHLFRDLENAYFDTALDPLPTESLDKLAIESIRRETVRAMTDVILEWVPAGADNEEEDHLGNE